MATRETRTGATYASGESDALETRTLALYASGESDAFETRTGVVFACDLIEPLSGTVNVGVTLTGDLTPVPAAPRITPTQRGYLAAKRAAHYMIVEVRDADGDWQDVANVDGSGDAEVNYLVSAVISQYLETPATAATVTIRAGVGATSIAPLMSASTANATGRLIDVARDVRIRMSVLPPGTTPVDPDDYITIFLGTIDRVSSGNGQTLTLACRDLLVPVLDGSFESTSSYGDGTTPVEDILQQMLNAALGTSAPTLITRNSPGWAPPGGSYSITARRGDSLWAKMSELVDQIGWIIRYRWNGPHISELVLIEPDRAATVAKYTLTNTEVADVQEASLDLAGVRNLVQIFYNGTSFFTATSSASIDAYRLRKLIIAESATSQIDTAAAAERMGRAILSDMELPEFTHAITHQHAFWPAEAGDVIEIAPNDVTHDGAQTLAVTSVVLTLDGRRSSCVMQMRGKPASRGKSWLRLAGASDDVSSGVGTPGAVDSLTITNTGTSSTGGNLVAAWSSTTFPAGGSYDITTSGSSAIASGTVTGVTSPHILGSPVYTDGIAPPFGKFSDFVFVTVTMRDSGGAVVATRSQLSPMFFGII